VSTENLMIPEMRTPVLKLMYAAVICATAAPS
jgi:hypothetical protein